MIKLKVLKVGKGCRCSKTTYGKILDIIYSPLFLLARYTPKIYKFIYKFIRKNRNFSIITRSRHIK